MKVTICFRNGEKINIECEDIETSTLSATNELVGYKINNITSGDKPVWFDIKEVLYITRKVEENNGSTE